MWMYILTHITHIRIRPRTRTSFIYEYYIYMYKDKLILQLFLFEIHKLNLSLVKFMKYCKIDIK